MDNTKRKFPLSGYDYNEQSYIYTLCEERRDWRDFIEKHITNSKEEIMGKDENGKLVSVSDAENDVKNHVSNAKTEIINNINSSITELKEDVISEVVNSKNDIKTQITTSENEINKHTTERTSLILNAIENLKTWWSTFRPSWA